MSQAVMAKLRQPRDVGVIESVRETPETTRLSRAKALFERESQRALKIKPGTESKDVFAFFESWGDELGLDDLARKARVKETTESRSEEESDRPVVVPPDDMRPATTIRAVISTAPRSLGVDSVREERLAMRDTVPTAVPMTAWVSRLIASRETRGLIAEIPTFDPADAGIDARVLLLMEAPGPMTNALNARPGSGFISSDNDDATAENLWRARRSAGLTDGALLWNVVPWYLGPAKKKPAVADLRDGAAPLRELIAMLPELHTVVTLGVFPRRGWQRFGRPHIGVGLRTIETWHPSSQAMIQPGKREHLAAALTRAARDWRRDGAGDRPIIVDCDRAGNAVAHWYANADGDRVDLHPRWW